MSRPSISWRPYDGPLDRKKMADAERLAYELYNSQKARSKQLGHEPPEYSAREFMGWWLANAVEFPGDKATCGRIDHSKGYSFDNIRVEPMKDNSREGMLRNKTNIRTGIKFGKKIEVYAKSGELVAIIPSIRDAARLFDTSQRLIQFIVRGQYKKSKKINFTLKEAA